MELLEEILNPNNLNKAYKKVVANKGVAGVEDQEVLNAVFAIFKDKFKDEFNFVD